MRARHFQEIKWRQRSQSGAHYITYGFNLKGQYVDGQEVRPD